MQQPRRDDEPDAVQESVCSLRKLRSVGVAVEDGEEADQRRGNGELRLRLEEDRRAETDRRERDPDLDAGQMHTDQSERPAEGHDHGERDGEKPYGGRPELGSPQADGDHGENVIETGNGMSETSDEARAFPALGVGERGIRAEKPCEARHDGGDRGLRARLPRAQLRQPRRIAVRWIVQKAPRVPTA